ncbi:MAG: hypothetical protein JSV09_14005, partial [Thermoplasmata archaeon]
MKNDAGNKKGGLVKKIFTITLIIVMVLSMGIGTMDFDSEIVEAYESDADSFGYYYTDSKDPDPKITYSWIDGVTGGNPTSLGDDDIIGFIPMGFSFIYYDISFDEIAVCSNGWVSFVDNYSTEHTPDSIPHIDFPFGVIAAFWTNLDPSAGGEVYYKSEADKFIITWWDVPIYGTTLLQRFEIVFLDTGEILFQYMKVDLPIPMAQPYSWPGVGIEDDLGESGLSYDDVIEDGLAIKFSQLPVAMPDDLFVTSSNLAPATVELGETDIPMLGLTLTADMNVIGLSSVKIELTGACITTDISAVKLWHDRNGNGIAEAIVDRIFASGIFQPDPITGEKLASLSISMSTGKAFLIRAGSPENLIITYDISGSAYPGNTTGALVQTMYVTGIDTVSGLPVSSSTSSITYQTQDTLTVVSTSLQSAGALASQGEAMIPMALLTLTAGSERVDIDAVSVRLSGSATAKYFSVYARLIHDVDDDGQFNAMTDVELGGSYFAPTPPNSATIFLKDSIQYFRVNSGITERLIITYDVDYEGVIGRTADVYLENTSLSCSPDTVSSSGFPFTSNPIQYAAFNQPVIKSYFTENPPTIDGKYSSGEWVDATSLDLVDINGNGIQTILQVMNDNYTLYLVLDAVGDTTRNSIDVSSISFDTGHDETATSGEEDQFVIGGWIPGQTAHYVFDTPLTGWVIEDSPFDDLLPGHGNLKGDWGFNTSDNSGTLHRFYEYQIPLALLGVPTPVPPGYTLGFAVGRQDNWTDSTTPGTYDPSFIGTLNQTYWPMYYATVMENMSFFGDLVLRAFNSPPDLDWTGEPGFISDGVNPDTGSTTTQFEYRVKYSDVDNEPPASGYPKLYIEKPCGMSWGGSPYTMNRVAWVG